MLGGDYLHVVSMLLEDDNKQFSCNDFFMQIMGKNKTVYYELLIGTTSTSATTQISLVLWSWFPRKVVPLES